MGINDVGGAVAIVLGAQFMIRQEVDVFLDKLVANLSQNGRVDRSELSDARFSRTRIRPGYAMPDVDTFLEEVAQATL
jgi:DivIVA domain-containing protein